VVAERVLCLRRIYQPDAWERDSLYLDEWVPIISEFKSGWEIAMENLQSVLETGQDLRILRRPMLGIYGGEDITEDLAAQLNIPVKKGSRIGGVVEGMGAQAVGLQSGDVIIKLDEKTIENGQGLISAIQQHRAGDIVTVVFYRGGDEKKVQLQLSTRQIPEVPKTPAGLAEMARKIYAENDAELEKCFEGVNEQAAGHRPAPKEWSAKEVLAHLILSERGFFNQIVDTISGEEPWYDGFGGNISAPLSAIISVFPSVSDLLQELKRAEAVTLALLAALPPEFAAHKNKYWKLGITIPVIGVHTREHLDQIKAALKSA
jgi:membrane-associated protease RseP (regulator of RpoE activity)